MVETKQSAKPWLSLYQEGIAPSLQPEFTTGLEVFRAGVRERPGHSAFWYFGRNFSYAEIDGASDALAAWLIDQGVTRGDRVTIVLQNAPEFLMMMVAAWKAGATPMPANPMYRAAELTKVFADARPRAILCELGHRGEIEAALAAIPLKPCAVLTTTPEAMRLNAPAAADKPNDGSWLGDVLTAYAGRSVTVAPPEPDELGLLLYTSGTTGTPKGAMIRHRSMAFNAEVLRDWCGVGDNGRILAIAPFFHITGVICHLLLAMSARATVIAHYRFESRLALDVIRETRPTFTIGAITVFNALMHTSGVSPSDFESFERVYSGGAPIPPALTDAFERELGVRIYPSYGMTETCAPTHLAPFGHKIPTDPESGALSIGIPVPSTEAMVADDNDQELPVGEAGEILLRGPQIMVGYWQKPEDSAAALRGGWMHTGDVGFRDQQGWFYLVDRKKDVIIASGFKVWPREVEDVLYNHPAVREAAVVGVADTYRGETVKAYIALKAGMSVEAAEIIAHCREFLAAYKAPKMVEVLPELPKTVTGKIQRAALRD